MAGLLIGSSACPLSEIVNEFLKPPMDVIMMENWTVLSDALKLPYSLVKKLKGDVKNHVVNEYDIANELLINWISHNAQNATIGNLLKLIEEKSVWKGVEGFLRTKIQKHAKNLDDLDNKSVEEILNCKIQFLGRECTLNSVKSRMKQNDFTDILKKHLNKDLIQRALKQDIIRLDNISVPTRVPYYINRTLIWKRKLDPAVFRESCRDIFVFDDIKPHHLTMLVEPNLTDISRNQLENLSVRFIRLECEVDLDEILKNAKVPVHRVRYKDDTFYWIFSVGSLRVIRSFLVDDEPEEISEDTLIKDHLTTFCSRPLAIVSTPGMGKSFVLGSLACQIQANFKDRHVLFLEMRSFVQQLKSGFEIRNLDVMKECITSYISESTLGQLLIRKLLDDDEQKFEVFLDGFDEIPLDQVKNAKDILNCLLRSKNIRAFVTSRPHMRDELEDTVGVISFDMVRFKVIDQISFLEKYWKNQMKTEKGENLSSITSKVISDISASFIGIPFQCFLLAEIYSKDVRRYLNHETDRYETTNPSKSLFDLYNNFIAIKFGNVALVDRNWIRKFHWIEAIKLLFPDNEIAFCISVSLEDEISQSLRSLDKVYTMGILEAERTTKKPVFVHKSLAEFLVSDMIVEYFKGNQLNACQLMVPFLLETVLQTCRDKQELRIEGDRINWVINTIVSSRMWKIASTSKQKSKLISAFIPHVSCPIYGDLTKSNLKSILDLWLHKNGKQATYATLVRILNNQQWTEVVDELERTASKYFESHIFVNNTVCFFLNAYLTRYNNDWYESISHVRNHFKIYQQNEKHQFLNDGVRKINLLTKNCYKHLLVRITLLLGNKRGFLVTKIDCQELLNCSALYGDIELFQHCCEIIDIFGETKVSELGFLKKHVTGTKFESEFTPLHCSLKSGNYKLTEYLVKYYKEKLHSLRHLYECILANSWKNSPAQIENKKNIIYLLESMNVHFNFLSLKENVPTGGIAPELFICISNIIGYAPKREEQMFILDSFRITIQNDFQMNLFVDWLSSKGIASFIIFYNAEIVRTLMLNNILHTHTLTKICSLCHFDLGTLIHNAIICKRAEEFVKTIVSISKNVNITDQKNNTMLHWAAAYKKPNIIRYLLCNGADLILKNDKGETPLILVHKNKDYYNYKQIQECIHLLTDAQTILYDHVNTVKQRSSVISKKSRCFVIKFKHLSLIALFLISLIIYSMLEELQEQKIYEPL